MSEKNATGRLCIACIEHPLVTSADAGCMSELSHYEFTVEQLAKIKRGDFVDLSKCHQKGSFPFSPNYATDYDAVFAAVNAFCNNPDEETTVMFIDADPAKSNAQIQEEYRRGIRSSGDMFECINHAKVTPERYSNASDYALSMGCPTIEIDLPDDVLSELRRR